jgi:hypothetical protein
MKRDYPLSTTPNPSAYSVGPGDKASDIITANNHGMVVNNAIRFLSIVTTTGISTNTTFTFKWF